ncbi:MAG TPA: hypothetical protein P5081_20410 [Phycisphaerae bacterium]|nr:hypothetical protein [Phycisphaerae bacterium]HRW55242.1 hypothetical protein [Phycisphaerae bacterium]
MSDDTSTSNAANAPRAVGSDRQYLNAADRLMLVAHQGLLGVGHSGFTCQTHVWFQGRVDVQRLRAALSRLNHRYPVITSRLVAPGGYRVPYWMYRNGADVILHETTLDGATERDVWAFGESLNDRPFSHADSDPIVWRLLHLPDGNDVLILLFSHALMDGKSPEHMLKLLDALWDHDGVAIAEPAPMDEIVGHLRREKVGRRARSAVRRLRHEWRYSKPAAMIIPRVDRVWRATPFRILVREMDEMETDRAIARVKRLCGFANLAPALLAGVFRSIRTLGPDADNRGRQCKTDVPLNLRPPGRSEPIFRNFMTFIKLGATPDEMTDSESLVRTLNGRMRDELRNGIDLGSLQMMSFMAPHANLMRRHLLRTLRKGPVSLGFGFLGTVIPGLTKLGATPIRRLYTMNAALSPPGITLQGHQYQGRLSLVLTHIGATVNDELAAAFLQHIMDELTGAHDAKT